jgi:hypothetical protein
MQEVTFDRNLLTSLEIHSTRATVLLYMSITWSFLLIDTPRSKISQSLLSRLPRTFHGSLLPPMSIFMTVMVSRYNAAEI